jgi:ABC-type sugar transport system substrate-binding protein
MARNPEWGRTRPVQAKYTMVVLAAALVLVLASCTAGSSPSPSASQAAASTAPSPSAVDCMTEANARVAAARAPLHFVLPTDPVDMAKNKGKTIWDIAPTLSNEIQSAVADGVTAAVKAAGMNVKVWDGKNAVPTENEGVNQAVAQHADGIILQSVSPALIQGPLAAAKAAGIPVIQWDDDDPHAALTGINARVTSEFTKDGEVLAAYALANSNCDTHALVLYPGAFANNVDISNGFKDEFTKLCPTCQVTAEEINPATMATTVAPQAQNAITRDPALRWIVPTFDYMTTFIDPAIQSMGASASKVKVISHDGNPSNLDNVRKGDVQVADMAFPPAAYQGWVMVDQISRLMAGQPSVDDIVPVQLVDTTNIPATNDELYASFGDYQAAFLHLWGLQ